MAYHLGAKADLYREVMRRAYQEELAADPDRGLAARRLVPALWMRRWLADAAEIGEPEADGKRHGGADPAIAERYRAHLDALVTSLLAVKR